MMNKYTVTVQKTESATEPDSFAWLHRYDDEAVVELVDFDTDGNELYTITTEADIDTMLNGSYGVLEYHCGKA